jgi:ABC-type uncharacterized transport system permease subunit
MNHLGHLSKRPFAVVCYAILTIGLAIAVFGVVPPWTLAESVYRGSWGSLVALQNSLARSTPLLACSLAVAIPARVGIVNLGGEGQFLLGAIGFTGASLVLAAHGGSLLWIACLGCGLVSASLAAVLVAFLRFRLGVNEILTGLMFNFLAGFLMLYLIHNPWRDTTALGWPYSRSFPVNALPPNIPGTELSFLLPIFCAGAVLTYLTMRYTAWGLRVHLVKQRFIAEPGVFRMRLVVSLVMLAMGAAFAGIAGSGEVAVVHGRLQPGVSWGAGFLGFLISWIGRNSILGCMVGSFLVGSLHVGVEGLQIERRVNASYTELVVAASLLAFIGWVGLFGSKKDPQMLTVGKP